MFLDRETQQKVENFRKYAVFISEKLGVEIRLDGKKAETDGKIISIPNIAGMDKREVDFLYAIVLHEVGHIRYTNFDPEFFKGIKSDAHFDIVNFVEDARIENFLMKDFDGARGIFDSLYSDFFMDKRFMNRVFGADVSHEDLWFHIGCHTHASIQNLHDFGFMRIINTDARKKLQKWVKTNKLDELIASHPMKTGMDAKELGTKIFNLYFKNRIDKSAENNMGKLTKHIQKAQDVDIEELRKKAHKLQKQLDSIIEEHMALGKELNNLVEKKEEFRKSIRPELDKIRAEQKDLSDAIKTKKTLRAKERKLSSAENIYNKKKNISDRIEENKNEAIRQMREEQEKDGEDRNDKKIDKLRKQIDKMKNKQDNIFKKNAVIKKKTEDYKKDVAKAQTEHGKLPQDMQDATRNELIDQFKDNIARKQELSDKLSDMESDVQKKQSEIDEKAQEYHDTRAEAGREIANGMKNLEDGLHEHGVPSEIMPKFRHDRNWTEGDKEQKKFDEQASQESGDVVCNGSGFGLQNTRDILALIDKTKNDLTSIDLSQHFLDTHKTNRLETFNDIHTEITYTQVVDMGENVALVHRKHVPMTLDFDKVLTENHSDGSVIAQLKNKNAMTLSQVKNVFRIKLKTQKRDKWKGNVDEGNLDTRSLYKLATKTDDKFLEINNPKLINKVKASIVIDNSGSLDKDEIGAEKLQTLAMLLSEGLNEVFVDHEISTYNAPVNDIMKRMDASDVYNRCVNSLETVIHKTFNEKDNKGIQNLVVKASDNSDGESIRLAVTRLLKQQSRHKVLFVVSDCKPFLSDANTGMLDAHLIETIKWARMNKVQIYSFSFGNSKTGEKFYGEKSHCNINDWSDLTKFLWKNLIQ